MSWFNVFAEAFVILAGFVIGMFFYGKSNQIYFFRRGILILTIYFLISISAALFGDMFGLLKLPLSEVLVDIILLNRDTTTIGILRFYGLIFITTPFIIIIWKKIGKKIIVFSLAIFLIAISVDNTYFKENGSFFIRKTLINLLEWQLFYISGMLIGQWFSTNHCKAYLFIKENKIKLISTFLCIYLMYLGLSNEPVMEKFPYSYERILYFVSIMPLTVVLLTTFHKFLKSINILYYINIVGRNSLVAFILADFFYIICKLSFVNNYLRLDIYWANFIAILISIFIPAIINIIIKISKKISILLNIRIK